MTVASIADHETRVRQRAYEIWDAEGRRDGWAIDHWLRAQRELTAAATPREVTTGKVKRVATPKPAAARARKTPVRASAPA